MKPLAIHKTEGGFTGRWIDYCVKNNIPYEIVNCYDTNIIGILGNCSGLMWHWDYENYRDRLFARQLITSLRKLDIKVFPDFETCWHFDDKVAQKYLLEAVNAPIPGSYVFYSRNDALKWAEGTDYPKVFKLRVGAGSQNVKLIKNYSSAKKVIYKAFASGFSHRNSYNVLRDKFDRLRKTKNAKSLLIFGKGILRYFSPRYDDKFINREKGYVYFQDFMPGNSFDTRLIIIGKRCFGVRRNNRKNDFRASGSGILNYDPGIFDLRVIKTAFETAEKLKSQSLALDFLFNEKNEPVIVEISFAFPTGDFTDNCYGYWDDDLNWHAGKFNVQHFMVEDLVNSIKKSHNHG